MLKLVCVSPAQFISNNLSLREEIIIASSSIRTEFSDWIGTPWRRLNNEKVHTSDSMLFDFDIINALDEERNLDLYKYNEFRSKQNILAEGFNFRFTAHLLTDKELNFSIIYEIDIDDSEIDDLNQSFRDIISGRNFFKKLNIEKEISIIKDNAKIIITNLIFKLTKITIDTSQVEFTDDSSYPLIFISSEIKITDPSQYFKNEEDQQQRSSDTYLQADYLNSYFHIGWNYGLIVNFPSNLNCKFASMFVFLQINYYRMRYLKNYFQSEMLKSTISDKLTEKDLNKFHKFQINYHELSLEYLTYKSGLYPKIYREFENIEKLWHMNEDTKFISDTFSLHRDFLDRKFQLISEETNKKQENALRVIAIIEIFAFYEVWKSGLELREHYVYDFYISTAIISVILIWVSFSFYTNKSLINLFKTKK